MGLDQHIQTHSSEKPFECNICTSSFKTKKYLSRHIKKVHSPATDHECRYCRKKFHYESLLKQHMYIHTGDSSFFLRAVVKLSSITEHAVSGILLKVTNSNVLRLGYQIFSVYSAFIKTFAS